MYNDLDLTTEQKSLLNDLIAGLKNLEKEKIYPSDEIKQAAVAMAQIMPREDFINLFTMANPSSLPHTAKAPHMPNVW